MAREGRKDQAKYLDQMKRASQARHAAVRRLVANHREEFQRLYDEEAAKVGVISALKRRASKIVRLKKQLSELEKE